jgi:hypothetical protein
MIATVAAMCVAQEQVVAHVVVAVAALFAHR